MKLGLRRAVIFSGLGASGGAIAALVGYAFRQPQPLSLNVKVDDITLSDQLWAIVAISLLGALVCGSIAVVVSLRKGLPRAMIAGVIAAPLGAVGCWGSRWLMDQVIYATLGGPDQSLTLAQVAVGQFVPFLVWQLCVALALTMPIVIGVGPTKFSFVRGLIGSVLVIVFGEVLGKIVGLVIALLLLGSLATGVRPGDTTIYAQVADVAYLFAMGAGAGLAFAVADAIYKPAWLTSRHGMTEGRKWALNGPQARIGSFEGNEVYLPTDGSIAPVHAQIHADEDAHYVVDLGPGVTVNGQSAQSQWLNDGDVVGVGSARLLYRTRLDAPSRKKEAPRALAAGHASPVAPGVAFVLVDPMGHRHALKVGVNTVGRDASCDVALTWEPSVSRRHAEVTVSPTGLTVRDLGSTNGTFIGGGAISDAVAIDLGDAILLGKVTIRVDKDLSSH